MTFRLSFFVLAVLSVALPVYCYKDFDANEHLLESNARWSENVTKTNPDFFVNSSKGQAPKALWIGCSDSRVPESVVTASTPGEIFVERNIANQLQINDSNSWAVLEYAVDHLHVDHVLVVGHTKCGGITASYLAAQSNSDPSLTLKDHPASNPLNQWLAALTRFAIELKPQFSSKTQDDAVQFLVEQNVRVQVDRIANSEVMVKTWKKEKEGGGERVRVHGWVYDLSTGLLKDLAISRGPT